MDIFEINHRHGRTMYILALEHAVNTIEIAGEDALDILKKKLEEEKRAAGE